MPAHLACFTMTKEACFKFSFFSFFLLGLVRTGSSGDKLSGLLELELSGIIDRQFRDSVTTRDIVTVSWSFLVRRRDRDIRS